MKEEGLNLPIYCIVGTRPVKVIKTSEGGFDVQAYDWNNGGFIRQMKYIKTILGTQDDVEVVNKGAFDKYVKSLKEKK